MAFPLLALLLLAQDAPVATAKAHLPPPAATAPAAAPATGQADADALPQGAPADDFGFVAWCDGVLAGHMDIAERVKDVLPLDEVQQKVGKAYLKAYVRALDGSAEGKTAEGRKRAEQLRQDGWSKWDQARAADHTLAAETYLSYQLPGRCEHAALRLSKNPNLFKLTPSVDEVGAISTAVRAPSDAGASTIPAASRPFMKAAAAGVAAKPAAPGTAPVAAPETPHESAAVAVPISTAANTPTASTPAAAAAIAMLPPQPKPIPAPTAVSTGAPVASASEPLAEKAPPAAAAAPAPAKAAPTAKAAEDKRIVKMPKKGHLLPPFLRKKDKDEDADASK